MHKIVSINIGGRGYATVYSITEINSEEEYVILPSEHYQSPITRIGYEQEKYVDNRSEYERWKDEYYYSYYPTLSEVATEVSVSPNVKKIVIPSTITRISKTAFKNVKDMIFEIDKKNEHYKVEDNKIIEISSGDIIWPYSE